MQKIFILIGFAFILIGILFPLIQRLGLGHLPGDIYIKRENFSLYFPLVTCLVLSVLISVLIRIFRQ